jgi:hypothetical protein
MMKICLAWMVIDSVHHNLKSANNDYIMKPNFSKQTIESRDYNIITCQDFNRSQSQKSLPPLRKLGVTNDHPYPRPAKFEVQ